MEHPGIQIRPATPDDLGRVDALLARSYPRLLAADYPPSVIVTALPIISRARPELLGSGRYFLALDGAGRLVGAGGYSLTAPDFRHAGHHPGHHPGQHPGAGRLAARERRGRASIRHVATDPDFLRQGIGRMLMRRIFRVAAAEGVGHFDCLATRTALPFYRALGFRLIGPVEVPLAPGISFPALRMAADPG